eukprot:3935473-Rhodomonas_salina.2
MRTGGGTEERKREVSGSGRERARATKIEKDREKGRESEIERERGWKRTRREHAPAGAVVRRDEEPSIMVCEHLEAPFQGAHTSVSRVFASMIRFQSRSRKTVRKKRGTIRSFSEETDSMEYHCAVVHCREAQCCIQVLQCAATTHTLSHLVVGRIRALSEGVKIQWTSSSPSLPKWSCLPP